MRLQATAGHSRLSSAPAAPEGNIQVAPKVDGAPGRIVRELGFRPGDVALEGGRVYFSRDAIWRMNKDGSDAVDLAPGGAWPFVVSGDSVFYRMSTGVYRVCK